MMLTLKKDLLKRNKRRHQVEDPKEVVRHYIYRFLISEENKIYFNDGKVNWKKLKEKFDQSEERYNLLKCLQMGVAKGIETEPVSFILKQTDNLENTEDKLNKAINKKASTEKSEYNVLSNRNQMKSTDETHHGNNYINELSYNLCPTRKNNTNCYMLKTKNTKRHTKNKMKQTIIETRTRRSRNNKIESNYGVLLSEEMILDREKNMNEKKAEIIARHSRHKKNESISDVLVSEEISLHKGSSVNKIITEAGKQDWKTKLKKNESSSDGIGYEEMRCANEKKINDPTIEIKLQHIKKNRYEFNVGRMISEENNHGMSDKMNEPIVKCKTLLSRQKKTELNMDEIVPGKTRYENGKKMYERILGSKIRHSKQIIGGFNRDEIVYSKIRRNRGHEMIKPAVESRTDTVQKKYESGSNWLISEEARCNGDNPPSTRNIMTESATEIRIQDNEHKKSESSGGQTISEDTKHDRENQMIATKSGSSTQHIIQKKYDIFLSEESTIDVELKMNASGTDSSKTHIIEVKYDLDHDVYNELLLYIESNKKAKNEELAGKETTLDLEINISEQLDDSNTQVMEERKIRQFGVLYESKFEDITSRRICKVNETIAEKNKKRKDTNIHAETMLHGQYNKNTTINIQRKMNHASISETSMMYKKKKQDKSNSNEHASKDRKQMKNELNHDRRVSKNSKSNQCKYSEVYVNTLNEDKQLIMHENEVRKKNKKNKSHMTDVEGCKPECEEDVILDYDISTTSRDHVKKWMLCHIYYNLTSCRERFLKEDKTVSLRKLFDDFIVHNDPEFTCIYFEIYTNEAYNMIKRLYREIFALKSGDMLPQFNNIELENVKLGLNYQYGVKFHLYKILKSDDMKYFVNSDTNINLAMLFTQFLIEVEKSLFPVKKALREQSFKDYMNFIKREFKSLNFKDITNRLEEDFKRNSMLNEIVTCYLID